MFYARHKEFPQVERDKQGQVRPSLMNNPAPSGLSSKLRVVFMQKHHEAERDNERNILRLLEPDPNAALLDLGCANGSWTMHVARRVGTTKIHGIELDLASARASAERGINVAIADLSHGFPFSDDSIDVIHSNQVIEHLIDVDNFVAETHRVLEVSGYAIISTENLSSVENLISLALGQQAFSQHISRRFHVGNVFSPHFGEEVTREEMVHRTVFAFFGLRQLLEAYGFVVERTLGAGYSPFPNRLALVDHVHARFITMKVTKASKCKRPALACPHLT